MRMTLLAHSQRNKAHKPKSGFHPDLLFRDNPDKHLSFLKNLNSTIFKQEKWHLVFKELLKFRPV